MLDLSFFMATSFSESTVGGNWKNDEKSQVYVSKMALYRFFKIKFEISDPKLLPMPNFCTISAQSEKGQTSRPRCYKKQNSVTVTSLMA